MTGIYFESKVKYLKVNEEGKEVKTKESYLIDAMSFTEAEARTIDEMESITSGEYEINAISKSNITEVLHSDVETDDKWYKAKVVVLDFVDGKSKTTPNFFLVQANTIERAHERLQEVLQQFVVPTEVKSVSDTAFMEVFEYDIENVNNK